MTQVVLGEATADAATAGQPLVVLEANVDDATGETLAHAVEALLDAGALDAWLDADRHEEGAARPTRSARSSTRRWRTPSPRVLASETGHARRAHGLRSSGGRRPEPSARSTSTGMPVRVKVSPGRAKAEHDDAARAARRIGRAVARGGAPGRGGVARGAPRGRGDDDEAG